MERRILAVLGAGALAACHPGPGEDPPASREPAGASEPVNTPAVTPRPPAEAPASLVGEYRVAGIDGTEVGGGIGIGLSITADEIYYEPRCAGFDWSYSYENGALAVERPADAPVCEIAVHPEKQRLATALDAVTQAARIPSNGIELSGGGHTVTLYSQ